MIRATYSGKIGCQWLAPAGSFELPKSGKYHVPCCITIMPSMLGGCHTPSGASGSFNWEVVLLNLQQSDYLSSHTTAILNTRLENVRSWPGQMPRVQTDPGSVVGKWEALREHAYSIESCWQFDISRNPKQSCSPKWHARLAAAFAVNSCLPPSGIRRHGFLPLPATRVFGSGNYTVAILTGEPNKVNEHMR